MHPALSALKSLDGLSVGDAFGQCFFDPEALDHLPARILPPAPWCWTDDTEMTLSIVEELATGDVNPDRLAVRFTNRHDISRGYGHGASEWIRRVRAGESWSAVAQSLFEGQGSHGNGAAMRAAPIGAYFAGDPARAAQIARLTARVTHAHEEGQVGAMAVAVAASLVAAPGCPREAALLLAIADYLPESETRSMLLRGTQLGPSNVEGVARVLGTGYKISSQDTVPFALFAVAHHLDDFEAALWWTVAGLGDRDTTCAIVGGTVALAAPPPAAWVAAREPLPVLSLSGT